MEITCLKISTFLFPDTYLLQSEANCMALASMTSAKSQRDKQIMQTLTWGFNSRKLLHENTVSLFVLHTFSFFCFKTYFLPMFKVFYVMFIVFFLFWWLLRAYLTAAFTFKPKQIETNIHKRLCQLYVNSILNSVHVICFTYSNTIKILFQTYAKTICCVFSLF